jgi:hypothetical protein
MGRTYYRTFQEKHAPSWLLLGSMGRGWPRERLAYPRRRPLATSGATVELVGGGGAGAAEGRVALLENDHEN